MVLNGVFWIKKQQNVSFQQGVLSCSIQWCLGFGDNFHAKSSLYWSARSCSMAWGDGLENCWQKALEVAMILVDWQADIESPTSYFQDDGDEPDQERAKKQTAPKQTN